MSTYSVAPAQTIKGFGWTKAIITTFNILESIKHINSSLLISKVSKTKVEIAVLPRSFYVSIYEVGN